MAFEEGDVLKCLRVEGVEGIVERVDLVDELDVDGLVLFVDRFYVLFLDLRE